MSVLSRFRLDGGTNQQAARKLLPTEGLLRRVQNLRLRRDNELGVRPGFSAFAASVYGQGSATLSVYDVCSYDERLFAFGDLSSNPGVTGFFEYVDELKAWRAVLLEIPDATNVREIGQPPDQAGGATNASVAARDGVVLLVFGTNGGGFNEDSFAHVFRAIDDVTLAYLTLDTTQMQNPVALVTEAGTFHAIGSTGSTIFIRSFDPASDETFAAAASVQTTTNDVFAAAAVLGSPGGYVVVSDLSGDLLVQSFDDAHTLLVTRTISGIVPSSIAIDANGPEDVIALLYKLVSDGKLYSYAVKLSDGSDLHGPDVVSTVTTDAISIRFVSTASALTYVGYYGASFGEDVTTILAWTPTTASTSGSRTWHGAELYTELAIVPGVKSGIFDDQVFCGLLLGEDIGNLTACMGISGAQMPVWAKDSGVATLQSGRVGGCAIDRTTGLFYAATLALNDTQNACPVVTEWAYGDRSRRQCAVAANELHIAGGLPLVFDGRSLVEIGFISAPCVIDLAGHTGGSITSDADYFIQASAEWIDSRRNLHRSPVSVVKTLHTGASDHSINYHLSVVQSLRLGTASNPGPGQYSIVEYRTAALVDKTAGENLFREHSYPNKGTQLPDTLTLSDDDLRALGATLGTIYTQGQTPVPIVAPPPCRYLWPTNDRLAVAGLPRPEQWIQSRQRFPGEAIGFASPDLLPGSQGSAEEEIRGIAALSGSLVAFTRRAISLWQGEGPDDSGQGAFSFAGLLAKEGGLKSWQSLCDSDEGVYFQRDDDQICMLDKTHGTLSWTVGQAVRDELALYPNVMAAVHLRREHALVFAVQNDAGNAGELLVLDLRRKQWFVDDVLAVALAEYQGRLVYVDPSGTCHYQDASPGVGAMPNQTFETFDFDFGSGLGWGDIINVGIVGTKVDDCVGTLDVTYDSGASYTTIGSWTLSTAGGYASGGLLQLKKAPPLRRCSRFGLRFNVTGGSDTEGVRVNEITLETEGAPGMARLPVRDTQ